MNIRKIEDEFSITGQIQPDQLEAVAKAGYKSIVCARPDDEEFGQPRFAEVTHAAERLGIDIIHIPISGGLGEGQIIRFQNAWNAMPKPMLGYCRSGARAGSLHGALGK